MPPAAIRLSPVYTGSKWSTVFGAIFNAAQQLRGRALSRDGTLTPRITNREAIALIEAWKAAAGPAQRVPQAGPTTDIEAIPWPLWYQYAAIAYGWDTATDRLDSGDTQAERLYPIEMSRDLWLALQAIALDLDAQNRPDPRVDLNASAFADPDTVREVARALREDGASAQYKIPVGCREPKIVCEEYPSLKNPLGKGCKLKCDDPVLVDDPITAIGKSLTGPVLIVAIILAAAAFSGSRRGRR